MIDSHVHLYDEKFDADRDAMIQRALDAGIERLYMPNCNSETVEGMLAIEKQYPGICFAMMGVHPCYINANYKEELDRVEYWLQQREFVAIGEIGLDYYWDKTYVQEQKEAFTRQMEWALAKKRPVVIHMRESTRDTLDLVKPFSQRGLTGVFHCFSGSLETAREIIEMGFYLGLGGVLTYPKAGIQQVIQEIDIQHLILETDAPYLSPVPHRGRRNEPAFLPHVATMLADLKKISLEELRAKTNNNCVSLFGS